MKYFFVIIFVLCFSQLAFSQVISEIGFVEKTNLIEIKFRLSKLPFNKTVSFEVFYSVDGGKTFNGPLKQVEGDLKEIKTNGIKSIQWNVFNEVEELKGVLVFEIRGKLNSIEQHPDLFTEYLVTGTTPFGFSVGYYKLWGIYASVKSNFSFAFTDYYCTSTSYDNISGVNPNGYYIITDKTKRMRMGFSIGIIRKLYPGFLWYVGAGYGIRNYYWNIDEYIYSNSTPVDNNWVRIDDRSFIGPEIESGFKIKIKPVYISFGINVINFKFPEAQIGLGVSLSELIK